MEVHLVKNKEFMMEEVVPAFRFILEVFGKTLAEAGEEHAENDLTDQELYEALVANNGEAIAGFEWDVETGLPMIEDDEAGAQASLVLLEKVNDAIFSKATTQLMKEGKIDVLVDKDGDIKIAMSESEKKRRKKK